MSDPHVYEKCMKDDFSWFCKFNYFERVPKNREELIYFAKMRYMTSIFYLSTEGKNKNQEKFCKLIRFEEFDSEAFLKSMGFETAPVIENGIEIKDSIYVKIPYF